MNANPENLWRKFMEIKGNNVDAGGQEITFQFSRQINSKEKIRVSF